MGCRRLTSCLCCDLPTGALVIGIVCLVFNALGVIYMSAMLGSPMVLREAILEELTILDGPEPTEKEVENIMYSMHVLFGLGLATCLVCAALDITLIVGTAQRRPCPLLAWVIGYCLVTAGTIVFGIYMIVLMVVTADTSPEIWFFIAFLLAGAVGGVYLIAVVYSYYKELREREQRNGGHTMQPLTAA